MTNLERRNSIGRAENYAPVELAMNWSVEYIRDKNYIRIAAAGFFTAEGQLQMMKDIIARDYWQAGMNILCDFRNLEFDADSLDAIRKVSVNRQKLEARIGNGKSALVMKSLADYARGRQYQLLTESKVSARMQVFWMKKRLFTGFSLDNLSNSDRLLSTFITNQHLLVTTKRFRF